jgi:hypothetical protein
MSASGLFRYAAAATLVRSADAGAGLALVLLAMTPSAGLRHPGTTGGLLVAALSAPHLAGPLLARHLDTARDGRRLLAAAFVCYAVALSTGSRLLGHLPLPVVGLCIGAAGLCGPLLTGGLSSRLAAIARPDPYSQRQAHGWDAVTYGLGGTAGPALVAVLATAASPLTAVLGLAVLALAGAGLTLQLPKETVRHGDPAPDVLTVREAGKLIVSIGPLRRVTYATLVTAAAGGGVALLAVALGSALSTWSSAGATLAAAFGVGTLIGSLLVTAFPMRGEPETLTSRAAFAVAFAFGLCAAAPTYPAALVAFTLAGAANAVFVTATLAARTMYAPPSARAQIFVSVAGVKVAAQSAGTAVTGALLSLGPRPILTAGAALTAGVGLATVVERRCQLRTGPAPAAASGQRAGRWPARPGRRAVAGPAPREGSG